MCSVWVMDGGPPLNACTLLLSMWYCYKVDGMFVVRGEYVLVTCVCCLLAVSANVHAAFVALFHFEGPCNIANPCVPITS
jgi:hypothetical protein